MSATEVTSGKDTYGEGIKEFFSKALRSKYKGIYRVTVENLIPTTEGRPLRENGIKRVMQSIAGDGWLKTSMPVVTLYKASDEGQLHVDTSTGAQGH